MIPARWPPWPSARLRLSAPELAPCADPARQQQDGSIFAHTASYNPSLPAQRAGPAVAESETPISQTVLEPEDLIASVSPRAKVAIADIITDL